MSSIDERVVRMKFDNAQFQQGVTQTTGLLNKLKQTLNLGKSVDSLKNLDNAAKGINFSTMTNGLNGVQSGFSAMGSVAFSVLNRLTNAAIDAGKSIASNLTAGIRDGLAEYETQMNSVQTILANTASKGENINSVNAALNELNTYADQTIYNFTEMTKNIGTFTAAGVDLKTSVASIKGIANLAAVSGSSSAQASTAMYQLSQAIAAGKVQLQDWNSVVNAGMGGETFQKALIRTSEHLHSIGKESASAVDAIKEYGSFRESLTKGEWLTTDVLTETLKQLSGAYDEADLKAQGYSEQQAKDIANLAQTAQDAATKVKTFTQLIDTTKEAIGSGWTQSWQIILGDFEEAKDLWTGVSDALSSVVNNASDARNKLLTAGLSTGYKQFIAEGISDTQAFNDTLTQVAKGHNVNVDSMIEKYGSFEKSMKGGWVTGEMLTQTVDKMVGSVEKMSAEERKNSGYTSENVKQLKALQQGLHDGSISADDFAKKFGQISGRENMIQGLKNIVDAVTPIAQAINKAWTEMFPPLTGDQLYSFTERFRDFTATLKPSQDVIDKIGRAAKGFFAILDIGKQAVVAFVNAIARAFGSEGISEFGSSFLDAAANMGDWLVKLDESVRKFGIFDAAAQTVGDVINGVLDILGKVSGAIEGAFGNTGALFSSFGSAANSVGSAVGKAFNFIKDTVSDVVNWIRDNVSAGDIFAGLAGGGILAAAKKFAGLIDQVKDLIGDPMSIFGGEDTDSILDKAKELLGGLGDALNAFTGSVKAFTLIEIAAALALLVNSMRKIGDMKPEQVAGGLFTIGALMTELNLSLKSISKTISKYDTKGIIKTGVALMAFAEAVKILAEAMQTLGTLDTGQTARGLFAIGVAMGEMVASMKLLGKTKVSLKSAATMLAMAQAVKMIADPLQKLGKMSWEEVGRGLSAMGGALAEMGTVTTLMGKFGKGFGSIASAASILIVAQSLSDIATALGVFGSYDWGTIARGLAGMGGALAEIGIVVGALGKVAGFSSIFASGAIYIVAQGLNDVASAFGVFGSYDWSTVGRGLSAMGGALAEIGVVTGALGKLAGISGIFGAGAIWITIQGLNDLSISFGTFGTYDWASIGRGLAAMGGALLEIGLVSGGLGKLAGLSGLIGAGAIWITIQGLNDMADAFIKLAGLSWEQVGVGLAAMGGALLEVGIVTTAVGKIGGLGALLGAGTIWVTIQGLNDLATSLIRFGNMTWEQVGIGLTAMGGALLIVGGMSTAIGMIGGLAGIIGAGTIAIVTQGLSQLADALFKFGIMDWETIGRGLTAMIGAMGAAGLGALLNTFSGFGADAISTMAAPLGVLADSVKKWSNVTVPENLGASLGALAGGVMKFTFGGLGAGALSTAAPGLSALADAVSKWSNVTVPADMEGTLTGLANGVKAFTLAFAGGWSLGAVTGPLGDLAGSVSKWSGVTVPNGMESKLTSLANGVKAFSLAFVGGWSLSAITGPLGDLAGSVGKWNGVKIPGGLESGLQSLANGVKAFSLAFVAGWSLGAVTGPLGDLAVSVARWNGVTIPANIGTDLSSLADALTKFSGVSAYAGSISMAATALQELGTATGTLAGIPFTTIGTNLVSFVNSVNNAGSITSTLPASLSAFSTSLQGSMTNLASTITTQGQTINAGFSALRSTIVNSLSGLGSEVSGKLSQVSSAVTSANSNIQGGLNTIGTTVRNFTGTMTTAFTAVVGAVRTGLTNTQTTVQSYSGPFRSAGQALADALLNGLKSSTGQFSGVFNSSLSNAANGARGQYGSFYSAGSYVASGFVAGIQSSINAAATAAASMAAAASNAAKAKLDIHSPSRVFQWIGQMTTRGFTMALDNGQNAAYTAGSKLGDSAKNGTQSGVSGFMTDLNAMLQLSPTITPVMDLAKVQNGVNSMTGMINQMPTIGTSFDTMLAQRAGTAMTGMQQAQVVPDNSDVVAAVQALGQNIDRVGNAVNGMQVVMDGQALVGHISGSMDQKLGEAVNYKGRWI